MAGNKGVERDERTVAVENASYSVGYRFMVFALLGDVAYGALKMGEPSWDLLAIVIFSGLVLTVYQARQNILTRSWTKAVILAIAIAVAIGFAVATLR